MSSEVGGTKKDDKMTEFTVSEVPDSDTFRVKPRWKWKDHTSDIVRPGEEEYEEAKQRLTDLILNKKVDIKTCKTINDYGRLVADVYYAGKNLADYFPEYNV